MNNNNSTNFALIILFAMVWIIYLGGKFFETKTENPLKSFICSNDQWNATKPIYKFNQKVMYTSKNDFYPSRECKIVHYLIDDDCVVYYMLDCTRELVKEEYLIEVK